MGLSMDWYNICMPGPSRSLSSSPCLMFSSRPDLWARVNIHGTEFKCGDGEADWENRIFYFEVIIIYPGTLKGHLKKSLWHFVSFYLKKRYISSMKLIIFSIFISKKDVAKYLFSFSTIFMSIEAFIRNSILKHFRSFGDKLSNIRGLNISHY